MTVKFPPTWVTVSIGLMLNVMAIVLSSQVLDKMATDLTQLDDRKAANQYSIQLAWDKVETLERKREGVLLHLEASEMLVDASEILPDPKHSVIKNAVANQLSSWVIGPVPTLTMANLDELMRLIDLSQQAQRDIIDNWYLENLVLTEEMQLIEKDMAFYKDIALFLQVFGLALILARDLSRR
ncbi:DNA mismatch repair protein [Vibrio methylphosphonaticus]|uniref:DNA mismatch repair protein n=1 Tax=Vibrio methylphosphonaticus TaxID=2946866 RepID=UPI002029BB53|nr:DNA mismatch repair protein [Vibrio methylphosphonaticus]MCL9777412.1 DNA mismatch repair protein [Vibrio methylphosphonaticus]